MSDQDKQTKAHMGFLERATALARDAGSLAADVASHATGAITEALSPANKPQAGQDNRKPISTAPLDGTVIRVYDVESGSYLAHWDALRHVWVPVMAVTLWAPKRGDA